MVAAWQSTAVATGSLGSDPVCNVPAGTVDGDLLIAYGVCSAGSTITATGAWTLRGESVSTAAPIWTRIASSEPANYTFTVSGATAGSVVRINRFNGHNASAPIDAISGINNTLQTLVIPSLNSGGGDRLLWQNVAKLSVSTWTPPASVGANERYDATSSAGGDEVVGSGATGTRSWLCSLAGGNGVGYAVAIAPASQNLAVTGFDIALDFGSPTLAQTLAVSGFDVPVDFGTPTLVPDQFVTPAGFDLSVEFGDPTIILDNVLTVDGFDVPIQFGSPALALQPTVTGTVFNHETGNPVGAGITVKLFDDNDLLVDTTVTDAGGGFTFYRPIGDTDLYWTYAEYELLGVPYQGVSERGCPAQ